MNIRDLKYLLAVARFKHFGKAAQACYVSQPTLSAQLKKLEEELNITIFERTNKSVLVTAVGEHIIEQARVVLQEVEQIYALARNESDPLAGRLDIGVIPSLAPYLLPYLVPQLKLALPNLDIHLHEDKTEVIMNALHDGELDTIILALPVPSSGYVVQHLFDEPFFVALPSQHALTQKECITTDDLDNETLLLLADGHCLRDQALTVCSQVGVNRESGLQAASLETLRQMVATGAGITLLPKLAILRHQSVHSLVTIKPFVKPWPVRHIGMLWREQSTRTKACQAIAECCQKSVSTILE